MKSPESRRIPIVAGIVLFLVRGVLLWVVVPIALVTWLVAGVVLRRHGIRLAQLLGWVDLNLIALIERSILRSVVRVPVAWTPARELPEVVHRIGWADPV